MARNILSISYAKRALDDGSREQQRMAKLATGVDRFVLVVFTRAAEGRPREYHQGSLSVYATHSRSRVMMVLDAFRIALRLIRSSGTAWTVSAQDPFVTSVVAWPVARRTDSRFHVQVHGDNFSNPHWIQESLGRRFWHWFGVRMLRRADAVRVVSRRAELALTRLGIETPISVLPVQVDLTPFLEAAAPRSNTTSETVRFLYVGRFSPEKEVVRIVRLFAAVYQEQPHARLTLVGEGGELSAVRAAISEHNITEVVSVLPWTDDVPGIMKEHDGFILCSRHEGFALVLLEAMAAGLAIVTTDVGCVGEWCLPGEHCVVLPHSDDARAAAAWREVVSNTKLRQQLGTAGQAAAAHYQDLQRNYTAAWTASFGA